jgi:YjbE family integral membrane protein|tara:strand:- start:1937 stop:2557 length:621 start_codon:yes stop_codon:yes gene_type:complete
MLEQFVITIQIILIDIVMGADNAIIIGLIASGYAKENRKRIIAWGVAVAFAARIVFAFLATILLQMAWLKIVGGLLLLWVVNNLRQDFFDPKKIRTPSLKSKESSSVTQGIYRVIIADTIISLDNVLGVVGAAKDNYHLMVFGLVLSVLLIGTLASYFANYIKDHKWLGYVGLFVIMIVALQLIIGGLINLEVLNINEKFQSLFSI